MNKIAKKLITILSFKYYSFLFPRLLKKIDNNPIISDPSELKLFCVVRNEELRLPYFFKYYKKLGVKKFIFIAHESNEATLQLLLKRKDTHVFYSEYSYLKLQGYGLNYLTQKLAPNEWGVLVDADEILLLPEQYSNIQQLTTAVDKYQYTAIYGLLLDMYSNKKMKETIYSPGQDPFAVCSYFDKYDFDFADPTGGMRKRVFNLAEAGLRKHPILKFVPNSYFTFGTHQFIGHKVATLRVVLCHFKYFSDFPGRVKEEIIRKAHWKGAKDYTAYNQLELEKLNLFSKKYSVQFKNARQLKELGFIDTL